MAQLRGQGSYGIGAPAPFGGDIDQRVEQSPLDTIRQQTSKIEDLLDTLSEPIKPYVAVNCYSGYGGLLSSGLGLIANLGPE